jgi:hypothetical protein
VTPSVSGGREKKKKKMKEAVEAACNANEIEQLICY